MFLVNAQEMRQMDRFTMEEVGIAAEVLMENAGVQLAREVAGHYPSRRKVTVVAGTGNNGGDGLVAARWLLVRGCEVQVGLIGERTRCTPECTKNLHAYERLGGAVWEVDPKQPGERESASWSEPAGRFRMALIHSEVVIDALFGVGLSRPVEGGYAQVLDWINAAREAGAVVVAADIPSGVDADTGVVLGTAVKADVTVTFACPKRGHYLYPGAGFRGGLVVADISIPDVAGRTVQVAGRLATAEDVAEALPVRRAHSHKGTYGHVLVVGGSKGMSGAPVLAASAALAGGAGLVTVAVPEAILATAAAVEPAAIYWHWPDTAEGSFDPAAWPVEEAASRSFSVLAFGPGLGEAIRRHPQAGEGLKRLLQLPLPLVIDADGLNLLAGHLDLLDVRRGKVTVLTPHPGEMARLLKSTVAQVEKNRWQAARETAVRFGVTLVLKGTHTLTAFSDGKVVVNPTGSPALAKAGSGDVLTGLIASFLGQGIPVEKAVPAAVYLHGLAGELAAYPSPHSSKPQQVIAQVGAAFARLAEEGEAQSGLLSWVRSLP